MRASDLSGQLQSIAIITGENKEITGYDGGKITIRGLIALLQQSPHENIEVNGFKLIAANGDFNDLEWY